MTGNPAVRIVPVPERLDAASVDAFRGTLQDALDSNCSALVLDFDQTKFVDSVGLGALVSLLKRCSREGIRLALAGFTPQVRQIFELTRLFRLFEIFETVEQAASFLSSPPPAGDDRETGPGDVDGGMS